MDGGPARVRLSSPARGSSRACRGQLRSGDVLVSLNGDSNVARVGTQPHRLLFQIGERYNIRIRRGAETAEYILETARGRPHLHSRLAYFLIGLIWCAVALFIGFARPQDAVARLAFAAATSAGLVFLTVGNLPGVYVLQPLHIVLGYHFFYRFPEGAPRSRAWRALLWLLYLCLAAIAPVPLWHSWLRYTQRPAAATAWLAAPFYPLARAASGAMATVAMVGAIAAAIHKYRALTDPDQRRRFHWVAVGGVVGLFPTAIWGVLNVLRQMPGVAAWLLPQEAWGRPSLAVSTCSVAVPVSVAYAVVKHRVFDVKVGIRRGLQYLLARSALQLLLALPSAALLYTVVAHRHQTISELVTGSRGYLYWILALAVGLRFRSHILGWLDRRFFREQYDSEQVLLSLVEDLARFDSVPEMTGFIVQQLERSLHPKSVYLWWREGSEMRLGHASGAAPKHSLCPLSEPLLERLARMGAVVHVPLPAQSGVSRGESRRLTGLGIRLIVPVAGAERLEGMLMLGEKRSEEAYSAADQRLLHAIARQTAVVRDNLRLKGKVLDEQRIRHEVLARLEGGLVSLLRECPVCGACYDSRAEACERDGNALTLTLPVARIINDRYRLDQLIGRGGMGAVYEARDLRLGRQVAVKVMLGGGFGHDIALRRFHREAQAVARLNHPNIVSLYDVGELEGGGAYLVMERLHGVTLRAELKRAGVFTPAVTADWFEQMLDGLAAAHEHGVVHRDFKPENVLGIRRSSGALVVKILDFGLAKSLPLTATAPPSQTLTESGVVLGTLAYMAPEQLHGKEVDQRADLYSAGVILVEMLTGSREFDADAAPLAGRFPALDAVLQCCLARRPEDRFASALELRAALIPALRKCG